MPQCFCQSNNCNGRALNHRAYAKHQREDKAQLVDDALSRAREACQAQDDAIASYVGYLTLSDELTAGAEDTSGGRIWCRADDPKSSCGEPSPHAPIDNTLDLLCEIEHELSSLILVSMPKIAALQRPSTRRDSFPLKAALIDARRIQDRLAAINSRAASVRESKRQISDRLNSLLADLRDSHFKWTECLKKLEDTVNGYATYNNDRHQRSVLPKAHPIVQASVFTMVALQVILRTSRRGCHFLLEMMRYVVQLTLMRNSVALSESDTTLLASFPTDPASTLRQFDLESEEKIFAVCPNAKCHKTYEPTFSGQSPVPLYPKYCNNKAFSDRGACSTRLTRPTLFGKKVVEVPIKRFVSFSFRDYVGAIISRPGFEDKMDASYDQSDGMMFDVSDGNFLRDFKGPDSLPFKSTISEGRYVFGLCVDFFNPFSNKQAGKKYSVGIISLVCLNLPATIRYRPENMFLAGIIPGPNEPPTDAINHYLRPLIDDFELFWKGIWYSCTHNHPEGRLILCALVLVVCDLPAARKTAGFAAASHEHFCPLCHCTRSKQGYNNIDTQTWLRRTNEECRADADAYRLAADQASQAEQFNKTGIRWSELARLSYFDMVRCVIIDLMHNLFLGLIKEHFTAILGIGRKPSTEKPVISVNFGQMPGASMDKVAKAVETIKTWLEQPLAIRFPSRDLGVKRLMRFNLASLTFVCTELRCLPSEPKPTKELLANRILDWRQQQIEERDAGADSATKLGSVISVEELSEIWQDLENLLTPSWIASVPTKLGTAAHGKLKADQWRVLGTIHLPLALTRIWSTVKANEDQVRSSRCHAILDTTMSLISAVIAVSSRSVTTANAAIYHHHMLLYLRGIKQLFPNYELHPNHHLALHLNEFILLFGPLHGWWTFPFERMIGAVQRMPHNGKPGELEETIARSYVRSANLRALMLKPACPEVIRHSDSIFKRLAGPQPNHPVEVNAQSFLSALDEDDEHQLELEPQEQCRLQMLPAALRLTFKKSNIQDPLRGRLLDNISVGGLIFSTFSKHQGNSCAFITFTKGYAPVPARIDHIVEVASGDGPVTYLAVRRFKPVALLDRHDPFLAYPLLRAKIWDGTLEDAEIALPAQIACHFACLPMTVNERQVMVCLSLSRDFPIGG